MSPEFVKQIAKDHYLPIVWRLARDRFSREQSNKAPGKQIAKDHYLWIASLRSQ